MNMGMDAWAESGVLIPVKDFLLAIHKRQPEWLPSRVKACLEDSSDDNETSRELLGEVQFGSGAKAVVKGLYELVKKSFSLHEGRLQPGTASREDGDSLCALFEFLLKGVPRWGLINRSGSWVLPPTRPSSEDFDFGDDVVQFNNFYEKRICDGDEGYLCGLFNADGEMVFPEKFQSIGVIDSNLFEVCLENHFGVVDAKGRFILEPKYAYGTCGALPNGGSWYQEDGLNVLVNSNAEVIGRISCDRIFPDWASGSWIFQANDKYGLCDSAGNVIIEPTFDRVRWDWREGHRPVAQGDKWGYIDLSGIFTIPCSFAAAEGFECGFADVANAEEKWGIIDLAGRVVIEFQWDRIRRLSDGLLAVKSSEKWGLQRLDGRVIAKPTWDEIAQIAPELFAVKKGEKFGIVDGAGKYLIRPSFSSVRSGNNSAIASVTKEEHSGFLSPQGEVLFDGLRFEGVGRFSEGLAWVQTDDGFRFINEDGESVIQGEFEGVGEFSKGLAPVCINDLWGFINTDGKMVIAPQFEAIDSFYLNGIAAAAIRVGGFSAPTEIRVFGSKRLTGDYGIEPGTPYFRFDEEECFERQLTPTGKELASLMDWESLDVSEWSEISN